LPAKISLEQARQEGYFIPFELVFADFAISGLTDDRPGFDCVRYVKELEFARKISSPPELIYGWTD